MTFVSQENQSHFVYRHPLDHVRQVVTDRYFQANLFRVDGASQNPLWHAVVSTGRYIYTYDHVCMGMDISLSRARSLSLILSLCHMYISSVARCRVRSQKSSRVD
jgi:hypothetical protein